MKFRFPKYIVDIAKFCEAKLKKIRVVWVERINLFQYEIQFVRLGGAK